ncbi:hypothetical protein [Pseudonocardia sp. NPDC049154]|uniref:hypothetical protein n=1 Tax=Pseudonocardia sp. NPDC049154 TaxID=3155501 RepID=UPI0033DBC1CE
MPYPTSCSPQAWASATPVQLVRTLLRFDPEPPRERLWVDPVLPPAFAPLRVEGVALGADRVSVEVTGDETLVDGVQLELVPLAEFADVLHAPSRGAA